MFVASQTAKWTLSNAMQCQFQSPCQKEREEEEEVGHTPTAAEAVGCHFCRDNVGMRFIRRINVPTHLGTTKEVKKKGLLD